LVRQGGTPGGRLSATTQALHPIGITPGRWTIQTFDGNTHFKNALDHHARVPRLAIRRLRGRICAGCPGPELAGIRHEATDCEPGMTAFGKPDFSHQVLIQTCGVGRCISRNGETRIGDHSSECGAGTHVLVWLVAVAVGMGLVGLFAFLWSLNSGQLEDLDGAAERILYQDRDAPLHEQERLDG
jgi:cbb3-type cytochrome oxidase maturation protein